MVQILAERLQNTSGRGLSSVDAASVSIIEAPEEDGLAQDWGYLTVHPGTAPMTGVVLA